MANKFILQRARALRHRTTLPEKVLWQYLRGKNFADLRFRRQYPIACYVVDFCCLKRKLVIELDGEIHQYIEQKDREREAVLKKCGFRVLHFSNDLVFENVGLIFQTIISVLEMTWNEDYDGQIERVKLTKRIAALLKIYHRRRFNHVFKVTDET